MRVIATASLAAIATLAGCATNPPLPAAPADLQNAVNARGANECNRTVASVLDARGVTAAQVTAVRYTESFELRGQHSFINGQTAWVYLQGQPGVGVVHLDSGCQVRGVSSDGAFRFPR